MPNEPLRVQRVSSVGRHPNGAALIEQQRGIAAHLPMRAERDRYAEHRGLQDRVQPGTMKAAADERGVAERVEIRENTDAIHDDHRSSFGMLELRQPDRARELEVSQ